MKYILFLLLFACESALAFLPAPGLWNSPEIDGQGFNIETQNNVMIVTSYVFDNTGKQIWYLSVGAYDEHNRKFIGTFANATNGSCLNCSYKAPAKNANAGGSMQINFDSRESGTIIFPGGSRRITHYNYGYSGNTGYFYGEWQFSLNISGIVSSQWVVFPGTTYKGSDGTVYALGAEDSNGKSVALAAYDAQSGFYAVAIDDGFGRAYTYGFSGDQSRMLGLGWSEPSGAALSGSGSPAAGNRILVQSELANIGDALERPGSDRYKSLESAIKSRLKDQ